MSSSINSSGRAAVELKPRNRATNLFGQRAENFKWQAQQEAVPEKLRDHVDLDMWQATFRAVEEQYRSYYNIRNAVARTPPVSLFTFLYLLSAHGSHQKRFATLVEKQSKIYSETNVTVMPITDKDNCNKIIGLSFEVAKH